MKQNNRELVDGILEEVADFSIIFVADGCQIRAVGPDHLQSPDFGVIFPEILVNPLEKVLGIVTLVAEINQIHQFGTGSHW